MDEQARAGGGQIAGDRGTDPVEHEAPVAAGIPGPGKSMLGSHICRGGYIGRIADDQIKLLAVEAFEDVIAKRAYRNPVEPGVQPCGKDRLSGDADGSEHTGYTYEPHVALVPGDFRLKP